MTREIFCYKNHEKNEVGRLVLDLFLFFRKAFYEVNTGGLQFGFNVFR